VGEPLGLQAQRKEAQKGFNKHQSVFLPYGYMLNVWVSRIKTSRHVSCVFSTKPCLFCKAEASPTGALFFFGS
jgi:hypothetical protein